MFTPQLAKLFLALGLCLPLSLFWMNTAHAQPPGGFGGRGDRGGFGGRGGFPGGGGGGGMMRVLMDEDDRAELNITPEQMAKLEALQGQLQPDQSKMIEMFTRTRSGTEEEQAASREEMSVMFRDLAKKAEEEVAKVLEPAQFKRLKELGLRQSGSRAIVEEEQASTLGLNQEQKDKINAIIEEGNNQSRGGFGRMSREDREKQRAEQDARILAVLTDEQKAKWTSMLGAPPAGEQPAPSTTASTTTPATPTDDAEALAKELEAAMAEQSPVVAPNGPAVMDFGIADALFQSLPAEGVETISFNFRNAAWADVLMLFAKVSGLTLDLDVMPPGYFNYFDSRQYTVTEALDVLNGYLIQRGYVLVKRDKFLVVAKIADGVPPALVPTVEASELPLRGRNEFVRVLLETGDLDAASVKDDLAKLISYKGEVTALAKSNQVIVTSTAGDALRIQALLEKSKPTSANDLTLEAFKLQYVQASEVESIVRSLLGVDKTLPSSNSSSRSRGGGNPFEDMMRRMRGERGGDENNQPATTSTAQARVTIDERTNTLLVSAKTVDLLVVRQAIEELDIPLNDEQKAAYADKTVPKVRVVPVKSGDLDDIANTVQMMVPGIVINKDNDIDVLHIIGTEIRQQEAAELVRLLDSTGGGVTVAVIPLNRTDAYSASVVLSNMFTSDGREAPAIQSDPEGRSLLVRGTVEQVAQVKTLLLQLGETGNVVQQNRSRGPVRRVPLGGQDPERIAETIEQLWNRSHDNKIRVITPSSSRQTAPTNSPSPEAPTTQTPEKTNTDQFETHFERNNVRVVETVSMQTETDAPPAEISIAIVGNELVISSRDEAMLDQLEDLLSGVLSQSANQTQWTVFYLRSAEAGVVASLLSDFFPTASIQSSLTSTLSSMSSSSRSRSSSSGFSPLTPTTSQSLRIIPDDRTNSLFVSGTAQLVSEVEQLLKILDVSDYPGQDAGRLPRTIPVNYAEISMVADIVKDTFRDSLYEPAPQQQGGDRGGGRTTSSGPPLFADRVTVAVDTGTSQLIVSANDELFQQIRLLVETLDAAARDARRTVRVVGLENTDATLVQQTLGALLPKVQVSTSSSRTGVSSSSTRSNTPAPNSDNNSSGGDDSARRDEFRRMMEERFRGGGGERGSRGGGESGRSRGR